ncbi:RING-H2 finger protein ATL13 [Spatholobus suberectus]|nr:RING-H2 finger protein ATL13 [Spatholobus suberectus]
MFMKYLTLFYTHLKWVLDFLLYYPFYKLHDPQMPLLGEDQSICHYAPTPGLEEDVDCAVCLCKIGDGEEIRVLRCEHFFHRNCLDTWVGLKIATCPLCREPVRPRRPINEVGAEVLLFQFCAIHTDDRDNWWLR